MGASQKTTFVNEKTANRQWWLFDLEGKTLGRAATVIANLLRGKTKPIYTPHADGGDFVVAINADKIKLTGKKWTDKIYYNHSGYPGGFRETTAKDLQTKHPDELIFKAVKGMLPKNNLSAHLLKKLKIFAGPEHTHAAQNPKTYGK